MTDRV